MKRLRGQARRAQQAFVDATNAAMRGRRLVEEGDRDAAFAAVTDAIGALERATDALEPSEDAEAA